MRLVLVSTDKVIMVLVSTSIMRMAVVSTGTMRMVLGSRGKTRICALNKNWYNADCFINCWHYEDSCS
jgi:hypothetical protein